MEQSLEGARECAQVMMGGPGLNLGERQVRDVRGGGKPRGRDLDRKVAFLSRPFGQAATPHPACCSLDSPPAHPRRR